MRNNIPNALFAFALIALSASGQSLTDRAATRFLDQATWGPTPVSIGQLDQVGINDWLRWQFGLNSSELPDQPMLAANGNTNKDLRPVQAAFFSNAVTGEDQLRQRVAFALSQIWVVSGIEVKNAYAYPPYWRIFRDNAFANYRDIIKAVTLNPAMGNYLDMVNNKKAAAGTSANENYGRELMQLFTLGLTKLHTDGTPVLDSNLHPIPTYDQNDVTNISRALTGWIYPTAPGAALKATNPAYYIGQMIVTEKQHDTTQKTLFGNVIKAGQTGEQDLESVLDALMSQDTMAPFVSQQLIQHLVTSNPSPAYIDRVSKVFLNNGSGIRGDMKAVITAILTDPDARAGDNPNTPVDPSFGHLREPVLFLANTLRGLNATLGPQSTIYTYSAQMGQDLFNAPSVFSYFSPQYRTQRGLLGPEFQIYSTQTAADRADYVNTILYGTLDKSTKINLAPFLGYADQPFGLLNYVSYVFLHHAASTDLLLNAADAVNAATTPTKKVQAALYMALTSSEYQIVH